MSTISPSLSQWNPVVSSSSSSQTNPIVTSNATVNYNETKRRSKSSLVNCYIPLPMSVLLSQRQEKNHYHLQQQAQQAPQAQQEPQAQQQKNLENAPSKKNLSLDPRERLLLQLKSNQRYSGDWSPSNSTSSVVSCQRHNSSSNSSRRTTTSPSVLEISNNKSNPENKHSSKGTPATNTTENASTPIEKSVNNTRTTHSLRRIHLETNFLSSTAAHLSESGSSIGSAGAITGSSLIEMGQTKVLCQVIGPITATSEYVQQTSLLSAFSMEEGVLYVDVTYASVSGYPLERTAANTPMSVDQQQQLSSMTPNSTNITAGKLNQITSSREYDLSHRVMTALLASIPLDRLRLAKTAIIVKLLVLQDDGSILPACVMAASLALVDASIELYDIVTACTVAVVHQRDTDHPNAIQDKDSKDQPAMLKSNTFYLSDPTLQEMEVANAVVTLATMPNWKEVTLWEQQQQLSHSLLSNTNNDGQNQRLTPAQVNMAMELCHDGCRTMHRFMREHFLSLPTLSSSAMQQEQKTR